MVKIPQSCSGFTLIEAVVTVLLITILALAAYPGYHNLVRYNRRLQAESDLVRLAAQVEQHYADKNSYQHIDLKTLNQSRYIVNGHYRLQLRTQKHHYSLYAHPVKHKGNTVSECGALWLDDQNRRGATADRDRNCWQ